MKNFKIRCSQIGKIMTNARSKTDILSATCKTYLEDWYKEQLYDRKKEVVSKYMDKGNIMEDDSIDFIANNFKLGLLIKNDQYFENDFMCGTPDLILDDLVIDVKNSWDCFTFPLFENEVNYDYYLQLHGYMALTGKLKAKLIYTLMDMPESIIEKEWISNCYRTGQDKTNYNDLQEFSRKYKWDNIPSPLRIKAFDINYNPEVIDQVNSRVLECRTYLNRLLML
jgi:hypothetical protein